MSESKSEGGTVIVSPECYCVECRRARRLETCERDNAALRAALEGLAKERDEALLLAFERGRKLAATIQARDEARKEAEALRRDRGRLVILEGPASGLVFTELGVRQLLEGREELAAQLREATRTLERIRAAF